MTDSLTVYEVIVCTSHLFPPSPPLVGWAIYIYVFGLLKEMPHPQCTASMEMPQPQEVQFSKLNSTSRKSKLPPGTTLVNPCKSPHPKQIWGCKFDVMSQGNGASAMCKLFIFYTLLPRKIHTISGEGRGGNDGGGGGNKWLVHY